MADRVGSCRTSKISGANVRFQGSPQNICEFRDQVYMACMDFWTAVAYWTAQFRQGDEVADARFSFGVPQQSVRPSWARSGTPDGASIPPSFAVTA
jgi:hypothetical protein